MTGGNRDNESCDTAVFLKTLNRFKEFAARNANAARSAAPVCR
jgi:hypothetical protein